VFPPADGSIRALPAEPGQNGQAVLAFTAHILVAAGVSQEWVDARLTRWELSDAYLPPFLGELARTVDRRINAIDLLALASPLPGPPPLTLTELDPTSDHPRVLRARRYRDDIRVWTSEHGLVTIGRGLAGRWEIAIEIDAPSRGKGLGRVLAQAARHLVPDGRPLWAQIAPGNAMSVRALFAAGFRPVGMEALLVDHATPPE
jgi:GNAT superfamily N-acetyltransferase